MNEQLHSHTSCVHRKKCDYRATFPCREPSGLVPTRELARRTSTTTIRTPCLSSAPRLQKPTLAMMLGLATQPFATISAPEWCTSIPAPPLKANLKRSSFYDANIRILFVPTKHFDIKISNTEEFRQFKNRKQVIQNRRKVAKKEEKKGKISMGIDCTSKTKCKKCGCFQQNNMEKHRGFALQLGCIVTKNETATQRQPFHFEDSLRLIVQYIKNSSRGKGHKILPHSKRDSPYCSISTSRGSLYFYCLSIVAELSFALSLIAQSRPKQQPRQQHIRMIAQAKTMEHITLRCSAYCFNTDLVLFSCLIIFLPFNVKWPTAYLTINHSFAQN